MVSASSSDKHTDSKRTQGFTAKEFTGAVWAGTWVCQCALESWGVAARARDARDGADVAAGVGDAAVSATAGAPSGGAVTPTLGPEDALTSSFV